MSENKITHPESSEVHAKPYINVTPLIDVLLVMLIIFMVVTPLKPARFMTKVPAEPDRNLTVLPPPLGLALRSSRTAPLC